MKQTNPTPHQNVKIVSDSAADLLALPHLPFSSVPLKVITLQKDYIDDEHLSVEGMVNDLKIYKGRSSTSCPNTDEWLEAFGNAEEIYCFTITGTLSGSYNAALGAKKIYEETHPKCRIFVFNTLSASSEIRLLIEKTEDLILSGLRFEEVCQGITAYREKTGLVFMLASMRNFANNGRVSPAVAKFAGLMGIRVVGKASDRGDLEPLDKCKGQPKALATLLSRMMEQGYRGGRVMIAHCYNAEGGTALKQLIKAKFPHAYVSVYPCRGLCSFYAEEGGLLVGFEKE